MTVKNQGIKARSGTFVDNLKLPIHRWFRYSAGFSAQWVKSIIAEKEATAILDPFAGSGTTLLAGDASGISSVGFEAHGFVQRIAAAKIAWNLDTGLFVEQAQALVARAKAKTLSEADDRSQDKLLGKMYDPGTLAKLESLRLAYLESADLASNSAPESQEARILWLGITAILRPCSHGGTAQWQYVLPKKTKQKVKDPIEAFSGFCDQVIKDSLQVQIDGWQKKSSILLQDARQPQKLDQDFDLLVTSPPYPNNYDYADATRLEMTFWKEIEGWRDLQSAVRKDLLRSCSQHSAAEKLQLEALLEEVYLAPIIDELRPVCEQLAEIRLTRGGRKTYHTMVAAYFCDLAQILLNIRSHMRPGSTLCFVIGDSAPYGVHVPAEKWLGELALAARFKGYKFEKLRDRNVKWDNRVHKVPLQEGNLWIQG